MKLIHDNIFDPTIYKSKYVYVSINVSIFDHILFKDLCYSLLRSLSIPALTSPSSKRFVLFAHVSPSMITILAAYLRWCKFWFNPHI